MGRADNAAGEPIRADTIFRIYSITKPIVGAALIALSEEGVPALRKPIEDYIPELGGPSMGDRDSTAPSRREMTLQDPMRHSAEMGYGGGKTGSEERFRQLEGQTVTERSMTSSKSWPGTS